MKTKQHKSGYWFRFALYWIVIIASGIKFYLQYSKVIAFRNSRFYNLRDIYGDRVLPEWYLPAISQSSSLLIVMGVVFAIFLIDSILEARKRGKIMFGSFNKTIMFRAAVVISVLWIIGVGIGQDIFSTYYRYRDYQDFVLFGIVPVIVIWGAIRVLQGRQSD